MTLTLISSAVVFIIFSFNLTSAQEAEKDLTQGVSVYLFNGYAAGYRFNECNNSFWRVNLDLYSNYTNRTHNSDGTTYTINSGDSSSYETTNNSSDFSISLVPQYFFKFYQNKYVEVYSGCGVLIGFNRDENKSTSTSLGNFTHKDYQYTITTGYSAGLIGTFGVEGKITENFSVFVESQLSGARTWSSSSSNNSSITDGTDQYRSYSSAKSKGWNANFNLSRAGITIKF